jgi:mannose-6-phosphate isomerase-like protein (cupin superfamily)
MCSHSTVNSLTAIDSLGGIPVSRDRNHAQHHYPSRGNRSVPPISPEVNVLLTIVGHDPNGKAIFVDDKTLTSLNPRDNTPQSGPFFGQATIHRTFGNPPTLNQPFRDLYGKPIGIDDPNGVVCRVIHFPPQGKEKDDLNIMHRTQSEDFGIVLEGEMQLWLEGGEMTTLKRGDVVVQRGTNHVRRPSLLGAEVKY